jgi:hypothetical protein
MLHSKNPLGTPHKTACLVLTILYMMACFGLDKTIFYALVASVYAVLWVE